MNLPRLALEAPSWLLLGLVLVPMTAIAGRAMLRGSRARLGALARLLLILAVVLAAAGLTVKLPTDRLGVVFVVDRSASVPEASRAAALEFVDQATDAMGPGDEAAVVVVGDGATVEREPTADLDSLRTIEGHVSPHQTDLAAGLRLAEALMPGDRTRRIVVLSDGEETRGDAIAQAGSAGDDVEIWSMPLDRAPGDEVLLEGMQAPDQVAEGAAFEIRVVARAAKPTPGRLHLYRNDRHLGTLDVQLQGGQADLFVLRQQADEAGFLRYRATLEVAPELDAVPQNNVAVGTVAVEGRPRILYVEGKEGQSHHLVAALEGEGLAVDAVGPGQLPGSLVELQPYQAVLLSDVPAYVLTQRQMEVLRRYVRDLGRGFAMLGGDESFGLGGYYQTPLEEMLPVRMDIQDKKYFPSLSMVLAIDKSGSMGGAGTAGKLEMAKEAAIQTTDLMADRDRIGVITFDGAASWAVPMSSLRNRVAIRSEVAKLRADGGTDIYPALRESYAALMKENTAQKHIVLLSDGVTMGGDFKSLIQMGERRGITLSAVAFGADADRQSMRDWAKWGGGRSYLVSEPSHIPKIFTREAMLATRSFLIEERFAPELGAPHAVTNGLGALPDLFGYVATEVKPRATVSLWARSAESTPLLATWRHGLGRTAAWTSDVKGRWAKQWVGTEPYTQVFTQLARWLSATEGSADVNAYAELDRGVLGVTVDAYDAEGGFRNFLTGEARFVAPDLSVRTTPLQQVAPGRYRAQVPAEADGSHLVAVFLEDDEGNPVGQATAEAAQPYSPEYRRAGGGGALLTELARVGRGRSVDLAASAAVFAPPELPRLVPHSLVAPLLLAAALLLLLDVALRRLEWSWRGARKLQAATTSGLVVPPLPARPRATRKAPRRARPAAVEPDEEDVLEEVAEAPPATASEQYVGGLLAARKRARDRQSED